MEGDCLVSGAAVLFQLVGWGSLAWTRLGNADRVRSVGPIALGISIIALGAMTLVGAMLQATFALMSGFTLFALLVGTIFLTECPRYCPDRYAAFYGAEES